MRYLVYLFMKFNIYLAKVRYIDGKLIKFLKSIDGLKKE